MKIDRLELSFFGFRIDVAFSIDLRRLVAVGWMKQIVPRPRLLIICVVGYNIG